MKITFLKALILCSFLVSLKSNAFDQTVGYVDRDRFMGTWYVMAGRFTAFEKDVYNSIERYTWNEQKNRIDIDFSYNQGALDGPLKSIPQKAWIVNTKTNSTWKVSPFWPLKFTYLVIALDPNYEWTAIGVPNEKYLWIMFRTPEVSAEKLQHAIDAVKQLNYNANDLVMVSHS